ncbi:glycosyltransferase family 4 protein [Oricola cellulosilytica]|uniref:Glycosyltransferase family 4 protein n=1 Tax=Oricola cellulosilytica TaxID=1429082 RepID=A0A4R0PB50_9HYPH|nr:glycosyltransferase family 4 protein [Oricola cellulosilytica]TCD14472.1 glycosyltransferase family 4 protein [Oricola cellulosilytica]
MRIALVTPLMEDVPPRGYGGTERAVGSLANSLTWDSHDVTVFATAGSQVDAKLVACRDRPLLTDNRLADPIAEQLTMLRQVREREAEFDIIHFHMDTLQFPLFNSISHKCLTTFHGRLDLIGLPAFYRAYRNFPVVSISDRQREPLPWLNWQATIHHGYALDQYRAIPRTNNGEGYLAFLGRISPEKGILEAIEIALRSGRKLKIAARVNRFDQQYWHEEVLPRIDGDRIEYVGEINDAEKSAFLSGADALLFPISWPEPFGLVMIEAMACGTPVIAFRHGAVPEVLEDGVTGRIVNSADEAAAAVPSCCSLDRARIRSRFETRFSDERMKDDYVRVYRKLARSERSALPRYLTPNVRKVEKGMAAITASLATTRRQTSIEKPADPKRSVEN